MGTFSGKVSNNSDFCNIFWHSFPLFKCKAAEMVLIILIVDQWTTLSNFPSENGRNNMYQKNYLIPPPHFQSRIFHFPLRSDLHTDRDLLSYCKDKYSTETNYITERGVKQILGFNAILNIRQSWCAMYALIKLPLY